MNTLIHADIFFFVTTIAVVIIALLLIVLLIYLIQIMKRVRDIAEQVREEAILFREDVHELRDSVRKQGFKFIQFASFFQKLFTKVTGSKTKNKT